MKSLKISHFFQIAFLPIVASCAHSTHTMRGPASDTSGHAAKESEPKETLSWTAPTQHGHVTSYLYTNGGLLDSLQQIHGSINVAKTFKINKTTVPKGKYSWKSFFKDFIEPEMNACGQECSYFAGAYWPEKQYNHFSKSGPISFEKGDKKEFNIFALTNMASQHVGYMYGYNWPPAKAATPTMTDVLYKKDKP